MGATSDLVGGLGCLLGGVVIWGFGVWASLKDPADGLKEYLFYVGTVVSLFGLMLLLLIAFTG
jgi:hypothetical protein